MVFLFLKIAAVEEKREGGEGGRGRGRMCVPAFPEPDIEREPIERVKSEEREKERSLVPSKLLFRSLHTQQQGQAGRQSGSNSQRITLEPRVG